MKPIATIAGMRADLRVPAARPRRFGRSRPATSRPPRTPAGTRTPCWRTSTAQAAAIEPSTTQRPSTASTRRPRTYNQVAMTTRAVK